MRRTAENLGGELISLRQETVRFPFFKDKDPVLSRLSLQEIVELVGGHVTYCGPFNALCEEVNIFQFWTREYVTLLGDYLMDRCELHTGSTLILDVGAGDGVLSQALQDYFNFLCPRDYSVSSQGAPLEQSTRVPLSSLIDKQSPSAGRKTSNERRSTNSTLQSTKTFTKSPSIIAVDDGSWRIPRRDSNNIVERLDVKTALSKYVANARSPGAADQQVIVLCSWMPMGIDWTSSFRQAGVTEYILIGECDDGQCGDNWLTWGNVAFLDDLQAELNAKLTTEESTIKAAEASERPPAPYQNDGYVRQELSKLESFQFSRYDCSVSRFSRTISFRKQGM
jgi:hypothetical protein